MGLWDEKFSGHETWKCTFNELNELEDVENPFSVGEVYTSSVIQDWCEKYEGDEWIEIEDAAFDSYQYFTFAVSDNGRGESGGVWFEGIN